jgi:hypothetical protein
MTMTLRFQTAVNEKRRSLLSGSEASSNVHSWQQRTREERGRGNENEPRPKGAQLQKGNRKADDEASRNTWEEADDKAWDKQAKCMRHQWDNAKTTRSNNQKTKRKKRRQRSLFWKRGDSLWRWEEAVNYNRSWFFMALIQIKWTIPRFTRWNSTWKRKKNTGVKEWRCNDGHYDDAHNPNNGDDDDDDGDDDNDDADDE